MFASGLGVLFWLEIILVAAAMALYLSGASQSGNKLLITAVRNLAALALNRVTVAWFALRT